MEDLQTKPMLHEALLEHQSKYRALAQHTGTALIKFTPNQMITELNAPAEKLFGLKLHQTIGKSVTWLFKQVEAENPFPEYLQKIIANNDKEIITSALCPNGETSTRDISWSLEREFDVTTQTMHLLASCQPLSPKDPKHIHDSIIASTQRLIEVLPGHIFLKDLDSKFLAVNQNFADASGFDCAEQVIGKYDPDLPWTDDENNLYVQDDQEVANSGVPITNIRETQTAKNGKGPTKFIITSKYPLPDHNGNIIGILGIYAYLDSSFYDYASLAFIDQKMQTILKNQPQRGYKIKIKDKTITVHQREVQCAALLLKGYSPKEMASELNVSIFTVRTHIQNLKEKLDCYNRSQLIQKILESHLLDLVLRQT